jgi:hypothetical protein
LFIEHAKTMLVIVVVVFTPVGDPLEFPLPFGDPQLE